MTDQRKPDFSSDPTKPQGMNAVSMATAVDAIAPVWFKSWSTEFERKVDTDRQLTNAAIQTLNAEVATLKAATVTRALSIPPMAGALGAVPVPQRAKLPSLTDNDAGEVDPDASDDDSAQDARLDAHSVRWATAEQALHEVLAGQQTLLLELRKTRRESAAGKLALSPQTKKLLAGTALAALTTICTTIGGIYATTRQSAKDGAAAGAAEAVRDAPAKILPVAVPVAAAPTPSGVP